MVVYFGEFVEIVINVGTASMAMMYGGTNFNRALLAGAGSFGGELITSMLIFKKAKDFSSHQYTYPLLAAGAVFANETLRLGLSDTLAMAIAQLIWLAGA